MQREGTHAVALLRRGVVVAAASLATVRPRARDPSAAPRPGHGRRPRHRAAPAGSGQLTDGLVHNDQFDFDDYGLTVDAALALDAVGGQDATVRTIGRSQLARQHVDSYTTGVDFGPATSTPAPPAKAAGLAQTAGADPTTFGGVDLVKRLTRGSAPTARRPPAGSRTTSESATSPTSIGQAFAAQGLDAAGSGRGGRRHRRSCSSSSAPRAASGCNFTADTAAADQTCDGGDGARASAPDTDATALAVLSLLADQADDPAVRRAIDDGRGLAARASSATTARFGGGPTTEAPNTNSTGLAAWALGAPRQHGRGQGRALGRAACRPPASAPCTTR